MSHFSNTENNISQVIFLYTFLRIPSDPGPPCRRSWCLEPMYIIGLVCLCKSTLQLGLYYQTYSIRPKIKKCSFAWTRGWKEWVCRSDFFLFFGICIFKCKTHYHILQNQLAIACLLSRKVSNSKQKLTFSFIKL